MGTMVTRVVKFIRKGIAGKDAVSIIVTPEIIVLKKSSQSQVAFVKVGLFLGDTVVEYGDGPDQYLCSTLGTGGEVVPGKLKWSYIMNDPDYRFAYRFSLMGGEDVDIDIPFTITYKDITYKKNIRFTTIANGEDGKSNFFADTDNDMISVATQKDGQPIPGQKWDVSLSTYFGADEVTNDTAFSVQGDNSWITAELIAKRFSSLDTVQLSPTGITWEKAGTTDVIIRATYKSFVRDIKILFTPVFPGEDGKDAEIYSIKPSHTALKFGRDTSGNITGEFTLKADVLLTVGGTSETVTDYAAHNLKGWYKFGDNANAPFDFGSGIKISPGNLPDRSVTLELWKGTPGGGGKMLDRETIPMLVDGKDGKPGDPGPSLPPLRGPQDWESLPIGYNLYAGEVGDPYKDVVIYRSNYYSCKKSHTKKSDMYPGGPQDIAHNYWQLGDKLEMVATKILLATYALVKNLGVEAIEMKDSAGNVQFTAKDGVVICNTGLFNNVIVSGNVTLREMYLGECSGNTDAAGWLYADGSIINGPAHHVLPKLPNGVYRTIRWFYPLMSRMPAADSQFKGADGAVIHGNDGAGTIVAEITMHGYGLREIHGYNVRNRTEWFITELSSNI